MFLRSLRHHWMHSVELGRRQTLVLTVYIVDVFRINSVEIVFLYLPLLRFLNDHGTVWVYFDFIDVNRMAQSLFAGHAFPCLLDIFVARLMETVLRLDFFQLLSLFDGIDLKHDLFPFVFIIYCQIDLQQMLIWVRLFSTLRILCFVIFEIVLKECFKLKDILVCSHGVPLCIPILRKRHFGAEFPSHVDFIATADEAFVKSRRACFQEGLSTLYE